MSHSADGMQTTDTAPGGSDRCPMRWIVWVAVVTALVQIASMLERGLWVQPDSVGYLTLAEWILQQGDFSHELFGGRTPGYPLFLAAVMSVAGPYMAVTTLVLQHALVVFVGVMVALTAWDLTHRAGVTVASGIVAGSAWSLTAYASTVLTEPLYTSLVTLVVWQGVRFTLRGGSARLAVLSSAVAAAALVRPAGAPLLVVCVLLAGPACVKAWRCRRDAGGRNRLIGSMFIHAACAFLPPLALLGGWSAYVQRVHGYDGSGSFGGQSLYVRVIGRDGWVDVPNPALDEIRRCVAEANRLHPHWELDYRAYEHAHMAGRLINGWSYQESGNQMGRAAVCAVSARPRAFAKGSIVHAARSLLIPDPIYLSGRTTEDGRFVDPTAPQPSVLREDFLTRMAADARSRDLIPAPRTGPAWPAWSAIAGCYEAWCVTADPVRPAAGDNLYENWVIWCCLGGVVVLATRRRLAWGVVALVVALQVVPPGIAPGATPRFVVPVRAWVDLWGVWLAVACLSWVVAQVRARRRWRDERRGASLGAADTALGPPAAVAFDAAAD